MPNTFQTLISNPEFSALNKDATEGSKIELIFQFHTILNNLSIQLCCPICQDIPTQPYLLPTCGHTFCYSCIKHWFLCNPSCPICRSVIGDNKPILNHTVKNIINSLIDDILKTAKLILKSEHYKSFKKKLANWKSEKNDEFNTDKENDFPWLKKIESNFGRAVVDTEDGVPRCSACHWELVDGHCENCGRTMVGWQDRTDGDELDDEDEEDDEEDTGRINRVRGLHSDSDEWEDFDNGLRDMPNALMVADEASEADEEEEDEDYGEIPGRAYFDDRHYDEEDVEDLIEDRNRIRNQASYYESDDGFVVEDDDVEQASSSDRSEDNSDVEVIEDDDDVLSGDEEVITKTTSKSRRQKNINLVSSDDNLSANSLNSDDDSDGGIINPKRSKPIQVEELDDSDEGMNDDDDSDDEFLKTVRKGRKKMLDEEDEEEEEGEEEDDDNSIVKQSIQSDDLLPSPSSKKRKHYKHKHRKSKRNNK